MKTTVTTREFDAEGRCVKETVMEYDYTAPVAPATYPVYPVPTIYPYRWQPNVWYSSQLTTTRDLKAGTF